MVVKAVADRQRLNVAMLDRDILKLDFPCIDICKGPFERFLCLLETQDGILVRCFGFGGAHRNAQHTRLVGGNYDHRVLRWYCQRD